MSEKKTSDIVPRLVTAVVAIPVLLWVILAGPHWAFFALVAWAGATSAWEYCGITVGDELPSTKPLAALLAGGVMATAYFAGAYLSLSLYAAVAIAFLFVLFCHKDQPRATHHMGSLVTAVMYGGLMFIPLALMRHGAGDDTGPLWVIMSLAIVWGSDTGAYFAGRAFGKHKLAPTVSPNKTIEGAIGSALSAVGFALLFDQIYRFTSPDSWEGLKLWQAAVLALPANFLGQTGDLAESLIKRAHQVKDSGTIIYGHGGMLDRIDALIFASPWFYVFVTYLA